MKDFNRDLSAGLSKTFTETEQVDDLCMGFEMKYSRWPKNIAELQNFVKGNKDAKGFDFSCYKNLTITETPKKTLKVHYDSFKKGDIETGSSDEELDFGPSK